MGFTDMSCDALEQVLLLAVFDRLIIVGLTHSVDSVSKL